MTMTRGVITFNEFQNIVGKDNIDLYKNAVIQCIEDERKISQFNSDLQPFVPFDPTTRAMIIHNRLCGILERVFENQEHIEANRWKKIFAVKFGDKILIRNKKFKDGGLVSSANTKQYKKFINQTLNLIPELIEQPHFIFGGYMLDKTATELLGVFFACHTANGVEWCTNVGKYVVEQQSFDFNDTQENKNPLEKPAEKKPRRVKPKKQKGDDDAKTANG